MTEEYEKLVKEIEILKKKVDELEKIQRIALQMFRGQHMPDWYYK